MGRIISYGEKTGYNDGDYLLMDNSDGGTKRIRADRVGVQLDPTLTDPNKAAPANAVKPIDAAPTQGSSNAVQSGGVKTALDGLQAQIPAIDPTLTQPGQAADAKVTGDKINAIQSSVSNVNASVTYTASGVKYPTPATMDMFERVVYDFGENIGFAPQGIAVHNGIAYVCNGATAPLNVIGEINLTDGSYVVHRIEGLVSGGNSVTLDYENNILYVASHNDRGLLNVVDINTWTLIKTIRMSDIGDSPEPNIVYDPSERCFYNCCCFDKIYKLDDTFTPIEAINLDVSGDNYPTAKPGTPQGFGYDGTFFYVPRSEVYDVGGNTFTFVYNKRGEFIKYFKGLQKEIEEYAYDFSTGKSYMCYAFGTSGWISEFVTDSGWLDMKDYISNDYEATVTPSNVDVANSTAQFRVINGMVMFKGYLKVDSFSTRMGKILTFLDGRLAPALHTTGIAYKTDGNVFTSPVPVVVEMSYFNPYVTPNYRYKYSPIRCEQVGYIWLDGIIAPCGRR